MERERNLLFKVLETVTLFSGLKMNEQEVPYSSMQSSDSSDESCSRIDSLSETVIYEDDSWIIGYLY